MDRSNTVVYGADSVDKRRMKAIWNGAQLPTPLLYRISTPAFSVYLPQAGSANKTADVPHMNLQG